MHRVPRKYMAPYGQFGPLWVDARLMPARSRPEDAIQRAVFQHLRTRGLGGLGTLAVRYA
jgi:hypothetical protein